MMDFEPFRIDDQYVALRHIKTGGFGVVYAGWDEQLDLPVAIKHLRSDLLAHPEQLQLFQAEARVVARLSHPAICRLYTLRSVNSGMYMIMEYISGCDLHQLLKSAKDGEVKLHSAAALYVVLQAASALAYAHDSADPATGTPLRLVHRDLAPSNLMVSRTGAIKLVDFGIARFHGLSRPETSQQTIRGRLRYMAPEQITSPKDLDHRSDIFSLAVILLELLTSDSVYGPTKSEFDLMDRVKRAEFDLQEFLDRHDVPVDLDPAVTRALQRRKEDRHSSMREFVVGLQPYLKAINYSESTAAGELRGLVERFAPADNLDQLYKEFAKSDEGRLRLETSPPEPPSPEVEDSSKTDPLIVADPPKAEPAVSKLDAANEKSPVPTAVPEPSQAGTARKLRPLLWLAGGAVIVLMVILLTRDGSNPGGQYSNQDTASATGSVVAPPSPQTGSHATAQETGTNPDPSVTAPAERSPRETPSSPRATQMSEAFEAALARLESMSTFPEFNRWFSGYRVDSVIVVLPKPADNRYCALFDSTDRMICIARRDGNKYLHLGSNREVNIRSARRQMCFTEK